MLRIVVAIMSVVILAGCSSEDASYPNTPATGASIVGRVVVQPAMTAVSGALVTTMPPTSSVVTGVDGTFAMTNVTAGAYIVTAARAGLDTQSVTVAVVSRQQTIADIVLTGVPDDTNNGGEDTVTRVGRIEGHVSNAAGALLAEVAVTLQPSGRITYTNALGRYAFDSVTPGPVVLRFRKQGYPDISATGEVEAQTTTIVDVVMEGGGGGVNEGLVAWWPLDGSATDASGNRHHGSLEGPMPAVDRHGKASGCYRFDGQLDRIRIPHSTAFNTLPLTFSCWLRTDGRWANRSIIMGKFLHPSGEGWDLFTESGILGVAYMRNNYAQSTRTDIPLPAEEQWIHVCGVFTEQGSTVYINGMKQGARPWTGAPSSTTSLKDLFIGRVDSSVQSSYSAFRGWIDDVKIFDRPLSAQEVARLAGE